MRSTTRILALAFGGLLLAACGNKDKDAPLAYAPADTPYVVANLDVLDDDTRAALFAQADAQMPAEVAQLRAAADEMAAKDPDTANLIRAFAKELDGKTVETFAQNTGLDLKGYSALYGLGLAPVLRFELSDTDAFEAFIGRLEDAYGKKLEVATVGKQSYRRHVSPTSGTELILAVVGKQAVAAILPADAAEPLLRQALGLDRPAKSVQEDGRLADLAKAKGYENWAVGELDLTRALPLAASGKDPLFNALLKARAQAESAKTGEPVANQLQIPPSCQADAARIANRVPEMSFGYTRLDPKHQDMRWDLALASDISQAFSGLKVDLPGLGATQVSSPFEFFLGLPVAQMRAFWTAQADAVAAKPFSCPALTDLNDSFAKLGASMQKAAIPPFGDLLGVGLSLDSFAPGKGNAMPKFTGRLVLGTSNPAGLLAMGQMMTPALAQLKLTSGGQPVALPSNLATMFGQPAWIAMGPKSLGLGVGAGEDAKLGDALKAPTGDAGQMLRMHLSGQMYLDWVTLMQQKADSLTAAAAALGKNEPDDQTDKAASEARTKAQFDAMRAQAARIQSLEAEAHVDSSGLVVTSQTTLK
ncbi:hypothetical protein [Frateuria sp. STR12]|uniref:hypothetical protein n=1 Tax=Frateuria hangzhouensis TaxID=2995589 RepID=UPI002260EADB|nr:hypothetical protein [Frateuria sp. STR12]MCX7513785.1 hypothetical protein [Frateuria sp. STR12]